MKKVILSSVIIIAFVLYVFSQKGQKEQVSSAATDPKPSQTNSSSNTSSSTTAPVSSAGSYKDGDYTGDVTDAYYGNLQVKAVISGGKITDVQFLQYPNDRDESVQISNASMPVLKSEAIQTQNATVDVVSGATQTSEAFVKSLASALVQAKN